MKFPPQETLLALGGGAIFVALGLVSFAAYLYRRAAILRAELWRETSGVVVHSSRDSAPSIIVRYEDAQGGMHEARSMGGSTGFPDVGEAAVVRYDPDCPAEAVIDVDVRMGRNLALLMAAILIGVGLVIVAGVLVE